MNAALEQTFRRQIEAFFGSGRCFLLAKGRVGLYVGLRAMNLPPGSKVVVPGYTCMVVPAAVKAADLQPVYVDIDPDTYNVDPQLLDDVDTSQVSAVIVQHTYGIPADIGPIRAWAKARGIAVIEDCCHTFGTRVRGELCGTLGAFAFMSGQWNKPFSTGLGGMLLVNDDSLAERVERILSREANQPGRLKQLTLYLQILAFELLVTPATVARVTKLYRSLNKRGLVIGSSSEQELQGGIPSGYLTTMAGCQVRKGIRELARIEDNIEHRKRLTALYHRELPEIGFATLPRALQHGLPLLRYPVRVANKTEVLRKAEKQRLEVGSWFEIPLHPAGTRMEDFGYHSGTCPQAEAASRQVINLPTHVKVDDKAAQETLAFLGKHAEPIQRETERRDRKVAA